MYTHTNSQTSHIRLYVFLLEIIPENKCVLGVFESLDAIKLRNYEFSVSVKLSTRKLVSCVMAEYATGHCRSFQRQSQPITGVLQNVVL